MAAPGIGRVLIEDSISRAPSLGFDAIQFNLVFASNPARALYEELGWREIGRVPDAVEGEPAIIYWRRTTEHVESRAAAEQESQRADSALTHRSVARSGEREVRSPLARRSPKGPTGIEAAF